MRFCDIFLFEIRIILIPKMNNSNAAAKRRRAGIQPTVPPMPNQPIQNSSQSQQQPSQQGLTLPQVIALIDTRLITLETFMKETKESESDLVIPNLKGEPASLENGNGSEVFMDSKEFTEFVDEVNQRFQLFADEINNMKEIVLKLQSYTMDVNKMLLERQHGELTPNISMEIDTTQDDLVVSDSKETFILESQNKIDVPEQETKTDMSETAQTTSKSRKK
jgi:hypothetical protein